MAIPWIALVIGADVANVPAMTEEVPQNQETDVTDKKSEGRYKQTNLIVLAFFLLGTMFLLLVPRVTLGIGEWLISLFK